VLAVLAGCSGLAPSDGGEPTATLTPAPVPADGPDAVDGVHSDRLQGETIVENHRRTLSNTSYSVVETLRMGPPENATYEQRTVKRVAPGGTPFRIDDEIDGPISRVSSLSTDVWWDGEHAYYRRPRGGSGDSVYFDRQNEPTPHLHLSGRLDDLLSATAVSAMESGAGNATIVAGAIENSSVVPRRDELTVVNNATMTVAISDGGRVRRLAIGYDATDYYDGKQRVRYTYRVTEVGTTTVEPPPWLANVENGG
jgi:hypothetical protein